MDIIKKLAQELAIKEEQAKAAVQLIDEGNTIPFIARYRKEMTGALNDETLRNLHERLLYLRNLEEKKEQVDVYKRQGNCRFSRSDRNHHRLVKYAKGICPWRL